MCVASDDTKAKGAWMEGWALDNRLSTTQTTGMDLPDLTYHLTEASKTKP